MVLQRLHGVLRRVYGAHSAEPGAAAARKDVRCVKYPDKYPNGFMYAVVDKQRPDEERAEALREGSQYFLTMIEEALNGFVVADAPMVLVALRVYGDSVKRCEPEAAEHADLIMRDLQVERVSTFLLIKDK